MSWYVWGAVGAQVRTRQAIGYCHHYISTREGQSGPLYYLPSQPRTAVPTLLGTQSAGLGVCEGASVLIFSSTSTSFLGGGSDK